MEFYEDIFVIALNSCIVIKKYYHFYIHMQKRNCIEKQIIFEDRSLLLNLMLGSQMFLFVTIFVYTVTKKIWIQLRTC